MIVRLYEENPNEKQLARITETLRSDRVIVYPTDGVYAFGCSVKSPKAIERLRAIRGKDKGFLTVVCCDLSQIADYARVDNHVFRILKKNLPGPFTFILNASSRLPDKVLEKRKTIGVRIPDNRIALSIIGELGNPLVTTSVKEDGEDEEYRTDPELIAEEWADKADIIVDGGYGKIFPTTVVDMTSGEPEIIRQAGGELNW